jgi:predicted DNA-binding protein (MmcQ/YjbR family)
MKPRERSDGSSAEQVKALAACTRLPGAELTHPFGFDTSVFKAGGKMFAAVSLSDEPGRLTLKCDPDYGAFLIQQFNEMIPGYHMNKRHWITITLSPTLPPDLIEDLISDSYDSVTASLPKRARLSLETKNR